MKKELIVSSKIIGVHLVVAIVIFFIFEILLKYPIFPFLDSSILSIILVFLIALYLGYLYKKKKKNFSLKEITLIGIIYTGIYLGINIIIYLILSFIHTWIILPGGYRLFNLNFDNPPLFLVILFFIIFSGLAVFLAFWLFNRK